MKTEQVGRVYRICRFLIFFDKNVRFYEMTSSEGNKESMYEEEMVEWEKELKEVREQVGFFGGRK